VFPSIVSQLQELDMHSGSGASGSTSGKVSSSTVGINCVTYPVVKYVVVHVCVFVYALVGKRSEHSMSH